jgi:hypothetical protein
MLYGVSKGATSEEILEAPEEHFWDQHLAVVYCS